MKHTPGPWAVAKSGEVVATSRPAPNPQYFEVIAWHGPVSKIKPANARLFAAAPEQNALLREIVDYRKRVGPIGFQLEKLDDYIHRAEVLISKAEGKP